jgi:uncharacterized protein YjbI with pentapeptide repeats
MKLTRPKIPAKLEQATLEDLLDGDLESVRLSDVDGTAIEVLAGDWDSVEIERLVLLQAQLLRLTVRDVSVKQSDLSSALLPDAAFNRGEFVNCRMTGVDFSKATLHDVVFRGCKLDIANFRFADIRRAKFIDCTLVETDFLGAMLHDVIFESCTLTKTVFDRVRCKQVDLRTSQLDEISGWGSLKGVTIDAAQLAAIAPYLAHELGIIVRET